MANTNVLMTRIDNHLVKGFLGETYTLLFGGSAVGLGFLDIITPALALIGAILALVSGIYTLKLRRVQLKDYQENKTLNS